MTEGRVCLRSLPPHPCRVSPALTRPNFSFWLPHQSGAFFLARAPEFACFIRMDGKRFIVGDIFMEKNVSFRGKREPPSSLIAASSGNSPVVGEALNLCSITRGHLSIPERMRRSCPFRSQVHVKGPFLQVLFSVASTYAKIPPAGILKFFLPSSFVNSLHPLRAA